MKGSRSVVPGEPEARLRACATRHGETRDPYSAAGLRCCGVWVPAFAGTTAESLTRVDQTRFRPSRHLAVVVDRDHLARDRLRRWGCKKYRKLRDVLRVDHRLDRLHGHGLRTHLLDALAADLRAAREDALDAVAGDRARRDRIGANAEGAELDGQRLGEADHRPLRRRI